MLVITGTYEHSIDAKHRLAIPADVRAVLLDPVTHPPGRPVYLYVTLAEDGLRIYPEQAWQRRAEELDRSEWDAAELLEYEEFLFGHTNRVELDSHGRILLPDNLLELSGLGAEVVLIGVKDHLAVKDRTAWRDKARRWLADKGRMAMNPRRMMHRPPATPAPPPPPDSPPMQP